MVELNSNQIQKIIQWVENHNLSLNDLKDEMIDHISCEVELRIVHGQGFDDAFKQTIGSIPEQQLNKIEEASLYLTNLKFRIMKQLTVISGLLVLTTFFLAFFSRIKHPQLTDEFLLAGMGILGLFFIPFFFISNYRAQKEEKQKIFHILGFTGTFLIALSAILSYFEVRFSGILIISGLVLLLFGFFPMFLISYARSPYLNLARGTLLLFLFISILSVGYYNVSISKDMVDYWLQQSKEINLSNKILEKISREIEVEAAQKSNPEKVLSIHNASSNLTRSIANFRVSYIQYIDDSYEGKEMIFSGMDYNRTGQRIIKSEDARITMQDIFEYKNQLKDVLSETNERESREISNLLSWESGKDNKADKTLQFLFYGYPAIVNSTILRTLESSILLSEIKTTDYLNNQSNEKAN